MEHKVCFRIQINLYYYIRVKDLTDDQVQAIRNAMEGYTVEGDLRREVALKTKEYKNGQKSKKMLIK